MVVLLTACFHEASITGPRSPLESGRRNHTMSFVDVVSCAAAQNIVADVAENQIVACAAVDRIVAAGHYRYFGHNHFDQRSG
jgi:hypothetical protein